MSLPAPDVKARLGRLFGSSLVSQGKTDEWEIESPADFPASRLVEAAFVLGCTPDELFTNFDSYDDSGCETCGPSIIRTLTLTVRRK